MEIRQYFEVVRRHLWIVALLMLVTVGGVIYQVVALTPQYEAMVSMLVTPRVTTPTAFEDAGPSAFPGNYREAVLRNTALLIQSEEVLQRVANKVGAPSLESLRRNMEVTEVRNSDFLSIKGRDDLPERAALIANTLAQEFMTFYGEINRVEARQSQQFVEGELRRAQDRLRAAERALLEFKDRGGAASLGGQSAQVAQRLVAVQAAYETATIEDRIARSRLQAIQERLRSQEDPRLASVSIATNPIVAQLRSSLTTLELELAGLRQANTDEHPKNKELLGRIADVRQRLRTEGLKVAKDESLGVSPIREQLVREMVAAQIEGVVARAKTAGIVQQLGGIHATLKDIPQNELTLARLERGVKQAEEIYIRLSTLHREAVIRENRAGSAGQAAVVLVDRAKVPEKPVSNQLPLKAGLGGLVALIVGLALAVLVDGLDDRIRSSRRAEEAYGVPVLAAIPVMSRGNGTFTAWPKAAAFLFPAIVLLLGAAIGAGLAVHRLQVSPDHLVRRAHVLIQQLPSIP